MRNKVRKSLAFLLALALVVSVMSGLGLSVSAEQESNTPGTEEVQQQDKTEAGAAPSEVKAEEEAAKPEEKPVLEEKEDEQKKQEETKTDDAAKDDANAQDGNQKDEPQAEPAAEEPAEPEGKPAASYLSTLSVEELYAYLTKLDDNNFAAAWKELTDSQKAEYNAYVLKMAFGDNKTTTSYEGGGAAASMTNVAGLVSALTANQQGTLRNSPARAARAAASSVTLNTAAQAPDDGLHMSKSITKAEPNTSDTGYKICLESYATGQTTTSTVTKSVPCDIVLVLDQSGSMADEMAKVKYTDTAFSDNQTNAGVYEGYSDNLFVLVKDIEGNVKHVPITVTRNVTGSSYTDVTQMNSTWHSWYSGSIDQYYCKTDGEEYKQLKSVSQEWGTYTYTCVDGTSFTSKGWNKDVTLYQKNDTYSYTYRYKEAGENTPAAITIEGNNSTIPTKTKNPAFFEGTTDGKLYYSKSTPDGSERKLTALQTAVRGFVASVKNDATQNNVDHNIAVVGFASNTNTYKNTEILTGVKIKQGSKASNGDSAYFPKGYVMEGEQYNPQGETYKTAAGNALQSVRKEAGSTSISDAIDALTAYGGTKTDDGMAMASDVFKYQSDERKEQYKDGTRNKVVILFTDGIPTGNGSSWNGTVANQAISNAKAIKNDGATVYTIGIFTNADANQNTTNGQSRENRFMHYVSSNYPNATEMNNAGDKANDGYYLTAANSADLNSIFQKISQSISESSSKVKLTGTTQTIDKMSAEFELPDGITTNQVEVYEVPCTSVDAEGNYTFGSKQKLTGATVSINKDAGTVSVRGFDYSTKYIHKDANDEVRGYKLLIEFPVEYKNDAWFGGNDIASNDIGSGIYDDKGDCHGTFEVPKVNRAIDYEIVAKDQTIYVTNQADLKELLAYPTKAGTNDNYKPDGIKNRYVNITYTLKDATGKEVGTYTILAGKTAEEGTWQANAEWNPALENCTEYTWTCTVTPNQSDGKSLGVAGTGHDAAEETKFDGDKAKKGTVHVLYPTVKAADKFIYWGESVTPADQITVEQDWTELNGHNAGTPDGTKPTITKEAAFQPGENSNTPSKDSDYNVIAKIGDRDITQLLRDHNRIVPGKKAHASCDDTSVGAGLTDKDFRIHVKVKKLTVQKIVEGNMGDTNQDFTFTGGTIYTNDKNKTEVKNGFTLKDGQDVTFKLKVGDNVSISETSVAGYETSYKVGDDSEVKNNTYNYNKVEANSPDAVTVTYTNKKQINPPNGIITTIAPYAIMVVLAAGAGVYFVYSRRRRNH